jgi:quercetin dioxygenase-like cupin family protein
MEGVRAKSADQGGRQVRLVEFAPGFSEAEWCPKAHVGYVLAGCPEVVFAEGVEVFSQGDALVIPAGDRHRARVVEGPVRLFLLEDA